MLSAVFGAKHPCRLSSERTSLSETLPQPIRLCFQGPAWRFRGHHRLRPLDFLPGRFLPERGPMPVMPRSSAFSAVVHAHNAFRAHKKWACQSNSALICQFRGIGQQFGC
jgi:hypothetical protein